VRARAEAATLGALSRSVLTGQDTAEAIVERVRETFGQRSVVLLRRTPSGWVRLAGAGIGYAERPEAGTTQVSADDEHVIVLVGDPLRAADQRVLEAFAVQTSLVLEYRRLREHADRAAALERAEATSTALLRAVSHDLRTPLATVRTAVDGLRSGAITEADREVLASSAALSAEQLEHLIDNLLDLSRVQAGLVHPVLRPVSLEECVPLALAGFGPQEALDDVPEDVPLVLTDPGLLERVVANLVANAVRVSAGVAPVRVLANVRREEVEILVVDRGPGVPEEQRQRMFEPFQRLDDSSPGGLGLGLAVARGLAEAIGGRLSAEDTPGGGLTMVVAVPRAGVAGPAGAAATGVPVERTEAEW
jgi:two-component system sensor histidine kinase KdpD